MFSLHTSLPQLRFVYLMFYMVFMAGPLLVAKMKSQLHLLCSVADCTLVMLDYILLSVELYKNACTMLLYGVSMIGSMLETDSITTLEHTSIVTVLCLMLIMYMVCLYCDFSFESAAFRFQFSISYHEMLGADQGRRHDIRNPEASGHNQSYTQLLTCNLILSYSVVCWE
jgi:hypothetical protein